MTAKKIEIHKDATPSEKIVQSGQLEAVVPDDQGRKLTLRTPDLLTEMNFPLAVGPQVADNQAYMRQVIPLLYLGAIDDERVFPPATKAELDALIKRLGRGGMAAIYAWYVANVLQPAQDAVAAAAKEAEERAALKNS